LAGIFFSESIRLNCAAAGQIRTTGLASVSENLNDPQILGFIHGFGEFLVDFSDTTPTTFVRIGESGGEIGGLQCTLKIIVRSAVFEHN
jgi:hypothetical protein